MAEFKRGDRIIFVEDDQYGGLEMPKGTLATYDSQVDHPTAPTVLLDSGERVLAWRDRIAPAEDHGTGDGSASDICAEPGCNCDLERRFPAPLDPKNVKPGDTVTVHVRALPDMPDYDVTGEVYEFSLPGAGLPLHVGGHSLSNPSVTLTAHTPAPEPEPEWKPGQFVSARVNGRESGERYQGFVTHHGTVMIANEDGSPESINLAHLRDIRPLVVIDPAEAGARDRLAAIIRYLDVAHPVLDPAALAEAILERLAR